MVSFFAAIWFLEFAATAWTHILFYELVGGDF
jgi:hypothetical protein